MTHRDWSNKDSRNQRYTSIKLKSNLYMQKKPNTIKLEPSPSSIYNQARISRWNILLCTANYFIRILSSNPFASMHVFLQTNLSLKISQTIAFKPDNAQAIANQLLSENTPIVINILKGPDHTRTIFTLPYL